MHEYRGVLPQLGDKFDCAVCSVTFNGKDQCLQHVEQEHSTVLKLWAGIGMSAADLSPVNRQLFKRLKDNDAYDDLLTTVKKVVRLYTKLSERTKLHDIVVTHILIETQRKLSLL